ncbi:molybdopterin-dependent oxidoreductase [Vibrio amylolyticus]|uniref:molybdopterin-dependent oxidoreductase n=1 Tax=Vibrio TaxID=662 RepID=UPI000C82733E|nr:molybdopterin-dependent oxidoreductase [Vibrio sp. 10N.261.55.A7]PMJ98724.1 hypothetical protein BCU12_04255 [Vibrio sp. 10N.261.55.A7]
MKWIFPLLLFISFSSHATPLVIRLSDTSAVTLTYTKISKEIPSNSFKTELPWYEESNTYTGIRVTDLISYLGKQPSDVSAVSFIALNDYAASTTIDDILQYDPIIAYKMNEKKMKVRNKGPYWLVFNVDKYPEIDNDIFYTQMVWQIDEVIIHSKP